MRITSHLWHDLLFHALATLPLAPGDASSLYHPSYPAWCRQHLALEPSLRTLPRDAHLLAALYDRSAEAHRLHGLAGRYSSVDEFLIDLQPSLKAASQAASQSVLAPRLQRHLRGVDPVLAELFCVALWSELRAGFTGWWEAHSDDLYDTAHETLSAGLDRLGELVPGVDEVRWGCSFPLRRSGRLLRRHGDQTTVIIGLPSRALDVDPWDPIIQGCHELMLHRVLGRTSQHAAFSTKEGAAGHSAHLRPEVMALCLATALLDEAPLSDLQASRAEAWMRAPSAGGLALPWLRPEDRPRDDALVAWVAQGGPVAPDDRATYAELLSDELASKARSNT